MNLIGTSVLMLGCLVAAGLNESLAEQRGRRGTPCFDFAGGGDDTGGQEKKRKPKFTVSKETTYVTGPLDPDGYPDYAAPLNERLRQGVTPANNANVLLWQAFGPKPEGAAMPPEFFQWMGVPAPPERGEYFIDLSRYMREHLKVEPGKPTDELLDQMTRAGQRPWKPEQYPHIAGWLKANEKPLAQVSEATKCSHYFSPLVQTKTKKGPSGLFSAILPGVFRCRDAASALAARAMLHAGEGRHQEAWQDLLACHRLGRLVERGGTLIEGLVGIAIDSIASNADLAFLDGAKLDAKQVKDCLHDLQQLQPRPAMADKVDLGERFVFLDTLMMVDRHGIPYLEGLSNGKPKDVNPAVKRLMDNVDWDPALRSTNRWYDRMAAAMREKDRGARETQLGGIEEELKTLKKNLLELGELDKLLLGVVDSAEARGKILGDVLISLMVPAVRRMGQAGDRAEQVQRNLHLAFALVLYHRNHGGYPKELDALTPKYLTVVPGDVYSGKALIYRPSETGYLLYSIGMDGRDDQGRGPEDAPPGDDLSVRMPRPKPGKK